MHISMDPWNYLQQRMNQLWREFDREFAPMLRGGASSVVGVEEGKAPAVGSVVPQVPSMPWPSKALVPLDLSETPEAVEVVAELPGISKDAVKVNVSDDGMLHIRGERHREQQAATDEAFQYQERTWGLVQRSVKLPATADPNQCEASFDNGVLRMRFKKRDIPGRSIEVK